MVQRLHQSRSIHTQFTCGKLGRFGGQPASCYQAWARGRVVVAARAAGLPPPVQSAYPAVHDDEGLAASTREGSRLGFVGRCAVHARQLPVIRAASRPGEDEVRRAREVLDRISARGRCRVLMLDDGSFVDQAMVAAAERVLALEAATR